MKQTKILTPTTHVNGWLPAVYMSCMSQNFRLFHVSNLSVRNFRIFLLMYTWSPSGSRFVSDLSAYSRDLGPAGAVGRVARAPQMTAVTSSVAVTSYHPVMMS